MAQSPFKAATPLLCAGIIGLAMSFASATTAQEPASLFKIITDKDEIIVGLSPSDIAAIHGSDASAIGKALAHDGEVSLWQFAVKKGADGELEQAPLQRISVLGKTSLRVEPYATPLRVLPAQ